MWHLLGTLLHKAVAAVTCLFLVCSATPIAPQLGSAGSASIRQEVNITDSYLYAASGNFATSSAIAAITDTNYTSPFYYFEVVASTTAGTNATISLVNATSSAVAATVTINGGNSYQRYRSSAFLPNASTTVEYKVRLNNEAIGKGIIASRIVVLQDTSNLTNTETQIEIGSATTTANNTTTLPLQSPKYWYYNQAGWDASPTFYAEVSYRDNSVASSTIYSAAATTSPTFYTYTASPGVGYVVAEAWGGGGGGDGVTSAATIGGGGGAGGAYARATTTVAAGSINKIGVGQGGAEGLAAAATASSTVTTADGVLVSGQGGEGATSGTGGVASTGNSIGAVLFAGGSGGNGETTVDTGGAGGGAGGPDGAGITPNNATNGVPVDGGAGDNGLGGAGGAAGTGADDVCDTENGKAGVNNVKGGGGGGGGDGDVSSICTGGAGGRPGGGGGGSDEGTGTDLVEVGGPGQVKITEWIGTVGIAIEEDNGQFASWAFKKQIVAAGPTSTTTARVRSASFTPTDGKHYRVVASTTSATASYDIYNAKIVVDQGFVTQSNIAPLGAGAPIGITGSGGTEEAAAQAFTFNGGTLTSVDVAVRKVASPTDNLNVDLVSTLGGSVLAHGSKLSSSLTTSIAVYNIVFGTPYLAAAGTYYIQLTRSGARDAVNLVAGEVAGSYSGGNTWTESSGAWTEQTTTDFYFKIYGTNNPTLLEPQYLIAPQILFSGTALQDFLTSFDTTDWGTTNNYLHAVSAADNSTSVVETDNTTGPAVITGSIITSPDNYATSTGMCLTSTAVLAPKATTNNNDVYSDSIIVQVGIASTASCGPATPTGGPALLYLRNADFYISNGDVYVKQ